MNQELTDYFSNKVNELIDGIDSGEFSKEIIPDKYTWEHLLGLYLLRDSLDGAVELYAQLYELAIKSAEKYISQKAEKGETIQIAFQSYSAAQWPAEEVYRMFEETPNVNAQIIVSPLVDRNVESTLDSYKKTLNWFKSNGYNVVEGMDINTLVLYDWNQLGGYPDVLYQLSSWFMSLPAIQWYCKLPLRCLVGYIQYGMYLIDNNDGTFAIQAIYNKEIFNSIWRVYCESTFNLEGYKKYQFLKGKNARYSGYAKMDYFYGADEISEATVRNLWKIPEGKNSKDVKKIIIAPHYSVNDDGILLLSTFNKNVWFWLYLAKKYKDSVSFIFKPHPNLRFSSVESKLFKSYEEYDEYIASWDNLSNGKAVQEADYLQIFNTSDAMIMDSGSFLGEYLYTGKPLLFLTRPEQCFLELGKKVVDVYYKTSGENYSEIEAFIQNVVINGNDDMKEKREKVFREEFDYVKTNGMTASEYICNEVFEMIGRKSQNTCDKILDNSTS